MNLATLASAVSLVGAIGGGGVYLATHYASAEDLQVVASQAQYSLDKHMELILIQINRIETKPAKTADDREQLRYTGQLGRYASELPEPAMLGLYFPRLKGWREWGA